MRCMQLLGIALVAALTGCSSAPATSEQNRTAKTGIGRTEKIVIVLESYAVDGIDKASESREAYVERCIQTGMHSINSALKFVSAAESRKKLYPSESFKSAPRSPWAIVGGGTEQGTSAWAAIGARYVISVAVSNVDSPVSNSKTDLKPFGIVTVKWTRNYAFTATVSDIANVRIAGTMKARAAGEASVSVFHIAYLPLLPYGYGAAAESNACHELGRSLAAFLEGSA